MNNSSVDTKTLFIFVMGIRCVAHTLQLAVLDTLKHNSIDKLLSKVCIIV